MTGGQVLDPRFFHQAQTGPTAGRAIVGNSGGTNWEKRPVGLTDQANTWTGNQTFPRAVFDQPTVDTGKIFLALNKLPGQPYDANFTCKVGTNPPGGEARHNVIVSWGTNNDENSQRQNTAWGAMRWAIEGGYYQPGIGYVYESHLSVIPSDGEYQFRPSGYYIQDATRFTTHQHQASEVVYANPAASFDAAAAWFSITRAGVGTADDLVWTKLNFKQARIPAPTGGVVWNEIEWLGFGSYAPAAGGYGFNCDVRDSGVGTFDWMYRTRHNTTTHTDRAKWRSNGEFYQGQARFGSLTTTDFTSLVSTAGVALGLGASAEWVERTSGSGSGHRLRASDNGSQGELLWERRNNSGSFTTMGRWRSDGRNMFDVLHLGSVTAANFDNALTAGLIMGTGSGRAIEQMLFATNPPYSGRIWPQDSGLGETNYELGLRSSAGSFTTVCRWSRQGGGRIHLPVKNSAPSNSYLAASEGLPYLDETAKEVKIKICLADGTTIKDVVLGTWT